MIINQPVINARNQIYFRLFKNTRLIKLRKGKGSNCLLSPSPIKCKIEYYCRNLTYFPIVLNDQVGLKAILLPSYLATTYQK